MTDAPESEKSGGRPLVLTVGVWVVLVLLCGLYVSAGTPKVLGASRAIMNFRIWGYSDSFRILIGVLEIAGGLGLLVPRLTTWAALGLVCIMLGAIYTHVATSTAGVYFPVIAALVLGAVGYARRGEALFLGRSGTSSAGATAPPAS